MKKTMTWHTCRCETICRKIIWDD